MNAAIGIFWFNDFVRAFSMAIELAAPAVLEKIRAKQ